MVKRRNGAPHGVCHHLSFRVHFLPLSLPKLSAFRHFCVRVVVTKGSFREPFFFPPLVLTPASGKEV